MSATSDTRTKIASVKNTQKITRAMQMVAASKMRKAQLRMDHSKPYALKMRDVIAHVANSHPEYKHPFLIQREIKRVGYIVVTSDRGLCGGLNINVLRATLSSMKEWSKKSVEIDLCVIGRKGENFFARLGGNVVAQTAHLGDEPLVSDLIGSVKVMLDRYHEGTLDALFIAYNNYINTMVQQPEIYQLLPVLQAKDESSSAGYWDYLYEPDDARHIITMLLTRYIESQVYQAVVENLACEQAARMVAMKSATDNAGKLIDELKLIYNKARQCSITNEMCEIVSGADAV